MKRNLTNECFVHIYSNLLINLIPRILKENQNLNSLDADFQNEF